MAQVYDFEGNRYDTVKIGNQVWLKQNIRSKKYFDGKTVDPNNYKCPNGDCNKRDSFGLLYNFKGLTNGESGNVINGICPKGYSIPTPKNWHELMLFLNADTTYLWKNAYNYVKYKIIDEIWGGTGETDLSILPAGIYFKDNYGNFGIATNIRLIESEQHKSVFISFDGGSAGTVNIFNFNPPDLAKVDYSYQSCRCIKSDIETATNNFKENSDWVVYPNPSFGEITLHNKKLDYAEIYTIEIISSNGQKTKVEKNANGSYVINNIPQGIYFVKILDQTGIKFLRISRL